MKIINHLLFLDNGIQVSYKPTPNHGGTLKDFQYLVCHFTADTNPQSTIGWFLNKIAQASAHLLIDRDGNITQFAPFNVVCWHAGASQWAGINGLNSHSIGIEMTNAGRLTPVGKGFRCPTDGVVVPNEQAVYLTHKNEHAPAYWQTYTDKQIQVAAQVANVIIATYKLKDIVGHDDIAPGRKSDPGPAFNMAAFKISAGMPEHPTKTVTVNLNMRSGPGVTNAIVSVLPGGTAVSEIEVSGAWSKVFVPSNGLTGYVNNNFIK